MKLFRYELKKVIGNRFVIILLPVLLIISSLLAFYSAKTPDGNFRTGREFVSSVKKLSAIYEEAPEEYEALYQIYKDRNYQALKDSIDNGTEREVIRDIDGVNEDKVLFAYVDALITNRDDYKGSLEIMANAAEKELTELRKEGITSGYTYLYSTVVYNRYAALLDAEIATTPTFGWAEYFSNDNLPLFLFAAVLLFAGTVFLPEKQAGMLLSIRAAKNGRGKTVTAKLSLLILGTVLLTALFSAASFGVIYSRYGLSSPDTALQLISGYSAFPFEMTVLEWTFCRFALQSLTMISFALIVAFLSQLFYNYILTCFGGAALFGVMFVLTEKMSLLEHPFLKTMNLWALSTGEIIASRLLAVNLFGFPIEYLIFAPIMLILLTALALFGNSALYLSCFDGITFKLPRFVLHLREKAEKSYRKLWMKTQRSGNHGLFVWEMKKLFSFGGVAILLILLTVWQGYICINKDADYYSLEYRAYIAFYADELYGEYTTEKADYLKSEEAYGEQLALEEQQAKIAFQNGEITGTEFNEISEKYSKFQNGRAIGLSYAMQLTKRLEQQKQRTGVNGWYLSEDAVTHFCETETGFPLYALCILLGTALFAMEYAGKSKVHHFVNILRSTKQGRGKTFFTKLAVMSLFAVTAYILFYGMEAITIFRLYECNFTNLQAPVCSIREYMPLDTDLTIGQYLITAYGIRLVAVLATALFSAALSCLCEKLLSSICLAAFLTALPSLVAMLGLAAAERVNFFAWFSAQEMFIFSAGKDQWSKDWGVLVTFTGFFILVTGALAYLAHKKFARKKS